MPNRSTTMSLSSRIRFQVDMNKADRLMRSRQPSHHHGSGVGRSDRGGSRSRRLRPGVERLEQREVMSAIPAPPVYQNPFMAPNNYSEVHLNSYQTDTFSVPGPASFAHRTVQQKLISPLGG